MGEGYWAPVLPPPSILLGKRVGGTCTEAPAGHLRWTGPLSGKSVDEVGSRGRVLRVYVCYNVTHSALVLFLVVTHRVCLAGGW